MGGSRNTSCDGLASKKVFKSTYAYYKVSWLNGIIRRLQSPSGMNVLDVTLEQASIEKPFPFSNFGCQKLDFSEKSVDLKT